MVAIDSQPARLDLARELGAQTIDAGDSDVRGRLEEIAPEGIDYAVDSTGHPSVLTLAVETVRVAGEVALVGAAPMGTTASIDMGAMLNGRRLRGSIQGDAVPQQFIPRLLRMHEDGQLPFERLITVYDFADINKAVHDMSSGRVIKPVLRVSAP